MGRPELVDYLSGHVTARRLERMRTVLADRTRWVTVVLEDIYQSHNASAVLRSCECFGIQDVHVVEDRNEFIVNRDVALGAGQWLDVTHWQAAQGRTIDSCCDELESAGYQLVAATPSAEAVTIDELDVSRSRVAVLFGTEMDGLTEAARERCREAVHVPMFGFTESFNISVSAALILRELTRRVRQAGVDWRLDDTEREDLLLRWLRGSINQSEELEARFREQRESP
jgi:tRNA (guanosine-2'-O-)-methyltransferase